MKLFAFLVCLGAAFSVGAGSSMRVEESRTLTDEDRTVHFFVLVVPDSTVQRLKKARQEEEVASGVTETGVYVGQIISGVLGGDVRPIFAGSASFIDEPDVQQGVSTILANVAPSVNNILKQWFARVQTALGITSTLRPGTVLANGTVVGQPNQPNQAGAAGQRLTAQQMLQLQQQQQAAQANRQQYSQEQVVPGSGVLSGSNLYEATTVEPLPLINLRPTDEDNEEESKLHKVL